MISRFLKPFALLLLLCSPLFAQEDNHIPYPKSPDGLRFYMNNDKSKWVQFQLAQQFWTRYSVQNPGTIIEGKPYTNALDFDLRRVRFYMFGQLDQNVVIFTQLGITNEQFNRGGTDGGKRFSIIFHDAWVKYRVLDDRLVVGTGLHFWNGLSRMSSFSFISTLAFDNPALNWPTLERTDQLGRMPGIFAHGQIHNLHYRVSINQPFRSVETLGNTVNQAMFQTEGISKVYAGYTEWNFLEKETHLLPFRIGTYLGKKKIFNIGAGFQYHKDVMASRQPNGFAADGVAPAFRIARHDQRSFAVDLFYDAPLSGDNGALTVYAVGYYNNMGPNYIRNIGVMSLASNPATPVSGSVNGFGNGYPAIGTGTVLLAEAGWLLPKGLLPAKTMLQPYYRHTLLNYDALNSLAFVHDFGVNWYLNGQNAKITLQNRFRPLIDGQTKKQTSSLYEFILQTSFYF